MVGFRRAFLIAGARALVVSLWQVPDAETSDLMLNFYQHLKDGATVSESLRLAQMMIRQQHEHPFYWGAFICVGDPDATLKLTPP